jgi:hypothetical protein
MSDLADDVAEQQADRADEWREFKAFAIVHPDGWTITRYTVMGQVRHLLWDAAGKARGSVQRYRVGEGEPCGLRLAALGRTLP